jgi:cobalamin biosynthesis protein CobT
LTFGVVAKLPRGGIVGIEVVEGLSDPRVDNAGSAAADAVAADESKKAEEGEEDAGMTEDEDTEDEDSEEMSTEEEDTQETPAETEEDSTNWVLIIIGIITLGAIVYYLKFKK